MVSVRNSCNVIKRHEIIEKLLATDWKHIHSHSSFGQDKFTIYVGNECVMVCKRASKLVNDVASTFPEYGSFYREREIDTHTKQHTIAKHSTTFYTNLESIRCNELKSLDRVLVSFIVGNSSNLLTVKKKEHIFLTMKWTTELNRQKNHKKT